MVPRPGLLAPGDTVSPESFSAAIQVREALRAVMLAHNGEPVRPEELKTLDRVAAASPLTVVSAPKASRCARRRRTGGRR
ncbi:ABATE domain-containing protein [Pyxidicoccus sp. MSG2]|uniref:ABATE domain-containing protein n=1 Tax=Pyxidicoccus sp. MSG2 TaxID=2996790 RepID=UPI00226D6966|nr:ABATE domain-containing protein [Pyxidicoccus sp. MSG2]MCY1015692.1 ABATE domain-containing protein [Pyxidicoccus sp. MSG2]